MTGNVLRFMRFSLPRYVQRMLEEGRHSEAKKEIEELLKKVSGEYKRRLEFELERLRRWPLQYPYDEEEAYELAAKEIKDLGRKEFRSLISSGCVDHIILDGELRVFKRFLPNMAWLCPRLKSRIPKEDEATINARKALADRVMEVKKGASPLMFRVKASLTVKDVPRGERVRVWIPIPRVSALHPHVRVTGFSKEPYLSDETHPQRTAYFELTSTGSDSVWVEYEAVVMPHKGGEIPEELRQLDGKPEAEHREERVPHITFSRELRNLVASLVRSEEDPLERARRIWDWVLLNTRYTYVHDYALFDNISEFAFRRRRGDCGIQSILLITMLRLAGIPARWQSGWYANPVRWSMHDWIQFYVEPFGWLYADPSFGHIREGEAWRRDFYFGGIEGFRLAFNSEISYPFDPPKESFRSDPVDSQGGEAEWDGGNIYDKMEHSLEILEVKRIPQP